MEPSEAIDAIDQLNSDLKDVFGKDSATYLSGRRLLHTAQQEAKEFAESDGPSDNEEYSLAHASQRRADAAAINSAWRK
jgi:hypothetical protein